MNKKTNMVKLGEVLSTSFTNGIYKSSDHYGTGVSILRITDFDNDGHLVTDDLQRVELSDAEVSNYKLQSKDIVINRVNSLTHIGKSILWMNTKNEMTVYESNMMRIKPKESVVLPEYLIKILHSYSARNHYKRVAKRAIGQSSINQQDVKSLLFFLPPLPEQQKIAKILSTWDKAISTTERLIGNSTQQKKALMQQLLTGKKRLLDDEGIRFESEWELKKVSDYFDVSSSKRVLQEDWKDEGVPFYRTRELVSLAKNEPFRSSIYIAEDYYEELITKYGMPDEGDFLVSGVGTLGIIYQVRVNDKFYFKDGNVLWFKKEKEVSSDFFKYCFLSDYIQNQINIQASVTTVGTYTITNAKKTKFHCPPLEEQQKIATVLTTADKEIELLKQQLADLQQEKKALMQVLLTGKVRVLIG